MAARGCVLASVRVCACSGTQMCAYCLEREKDAHTLNHFLTLSQAHERPERREVRENAFWKRREVVVVKTKHAESRTEGESGLKLEILSCTRTH